MSAWDCHLVKSSPRYEKWREILGTDEVPIISPLPVMALLGDEQVEVHQLDLPRLDAAQRSRLIDFIVERFGEKRDVVEAELDATGFPIRARDVIVSIPLRFFT